MDNADVNGVACHTKCTRVESAAVGDLAHWGAYVTHCVHHPLTGLRDGADHDSHTQQAVSSRPEYMSTLCQKGMDELDFR